MKKARIQLVTVALVFLLTSMMVPTFLINNVSASDDDALGTTICYRDGIWWRIETDFITILFPAAGKKPMFLWWYSNDTNNIYVVKYKGLIEYLTFDDPYYIHRYEANKLTIQERLEAKYAIAGPHQVQIENRIRKHWAWSLGFHPAYLPFSACQWSLTGPENVTRPDGVSYVSFNFTLVKAPKIFEFAENNVMIRCRFYATDATEEVHGLYNYTVHAGELKMDMVIQNWDWNIDKLRDLYQVLHDEFNITVPKVRAGLALWVDLASIEIMDLPIAEQDANFTLQILPENSYSSPVEPVEARSTTSDIIVGGQRVRIENKTGTDETPIPLKNRKGDCYRLRFAEGSQALAGFFDFVDKAVVINATGEVATVNVTAAYKAAGNRMRLFIGYPYFGNYTLEHDPSIGVESVTLWLSTNLILILVGATVIIAVSVAAVKMRKKTVNIVGVK